ncbi:hypothetical protein, partial [Bacillus mycoides]|uniref:hypothetical protein n=1 Tax=Bacillus mycoides TaxID=1405 RepID=UPI003A80B2E9
HNGMLSKMYYIEDGLSLKEQLNNDRFITLMEAENGAAMEVHVDRIYHAHYVNSEGNVITRW